WISNFAVGLWTPPLLEAIGWGTYIFYAAWNVVAFFVVWKWFVETKGKSLEEIDALFKDNAAAVGIDNSFETDRKNFEKPYKHSTEDTVSHEHKEHV
ncbi:hypothetical protein BD560DRAFT_342143, partial [Blakeslea trispora]